MDQFCRMVALSALWWDTINDARAELLRVGAAINAENAIRYTEYAMSQSSVVPCTFN